MPSLTDARTSNAAFRPSYTPVAVFVGGTSGVGEAMAKTLSSYLGGNLHLVIVGRNRDAAEKIFASLPRPEGVLREFVSCDAYLMRNISVSCKELSDKLAAVGGRINFLVMSAGYLRFAGRDETEEGNDKMMVMRYYNRFKFANELLPLLKMARDAKEDAQVKTILAPGKKSIGVNREDLGLKKNHTWWEAVSKPSVYNDVMVEEFAIQNAGIGFTHIHPGFVDTPAIEQLFIWRPMRILKPFLRIYLYFFGVSAQECAEYMLLALLDKKTEGWSRKDKHGDDIGSAGFNLSKEDKQAVWQHSLEVTACV